MEPPASLEAMWIKFTADTQFNPANGTDMGLFYAGATSVLVLLENTPGDLKSVVTLLSKLRREIMDEARKHSPRPI